MSNLPITSRIKRSPLLQQAAGAIDPDNPNVVTVGGITQGPDVTTTEKVITQGKLTGKKDKKQMSNEKWKEYLKNETPEQKAKRKEREIKAGLREPDKEEVKTTVKPGEQTVWEGAIKEETKGDVFQPWETRQMSRSIKKEQKDIRRSKIKEARANGTLTPELRKQFKAEEAKAEKEEFQAMADRAKAARGSGKKGGSSDVTTGQTDKLQGKLTKEEQKKMLAEKVAREAAKNKKTTEEKEEAPKPSPAGMNPSAFKMYAKSPATKKLQGAQNTLPQQLQDAIKAAPGKMKSPMKKGYFKKY